MINTEGDLGILNVGLVGHIDHGKTTLLHKLSGKWTDTHSEELKRGITIKLGYADCDIYFDEKDGYNISKKGRKVRSVSFVDAPGHEMLMATMLSGAALIDVALLVIAANEGIKPQSREHLMALRAKGIKNLIVIQNKIDLVSEQEARKNYEEIKEFLDSFYKDMPIIPVSAQQEVNIDVILKALTEIRVSDRDLKGNPVFLVARSFDVNRPGVDVEDLKGAILGGTLKSGILKKGQEIEIKPGRIVKEANKYHYETIRTKILRLFRGSKEVDELVPGGSTSMETDLDMSYGKGDVLSGNVVSLGGKLPELVENLKVNFELFPEVFGIGGHTKVEKIKHGETLMLSINTSTTGGLINGIKEGEISISLKKPVVVFREDNVGIARNVGGHWRLIGYGKVI